MLWPSIIIILAFIVFATIMGYLFVMPLIAVAANTIILYFFFLRIYTEITKYKRAEQYAYGFIAAILLLLITKNFLPVWWITTATILAFVITHAYITLKK